MNITGNIGKLSNVKNISTNSNDKSTVQTNGKK